jgi:hypothetical protein
MSFWARDLPKNYVPFVDHTEARNATAPSMAGPRRRASIEGLIIRLPAYGRAAAPNGLVP